MNIELPLEDTAVSKEDEKDANEDVGNLDDFCLATIKKANPKSSKLTLENVTTIIENVGRGVSIPNSAMYVGISPFTLTRWFKEGCEEFENITEEEVENADGDLESLLSLKGLLYLGICKSRAKCVVDIHSSLYDRSFEAGKEYVAMYLLERQEPEKYNLKFKVQQELNANVQASPVEFRFLNGMEARGNDDMESIKSTMKDLKKQYSDRDIELSSQNQDD